MSFIEDVKKAIEPKLQELGYELFELSFAKDGSDMTLRVRVDKPGNRIGLDQIVSVSEALSPILDQLNFTDSNYVLDVSSAGAEHAIKLDDLPKYVGAYVNLHLRDPIDGQNVYEGDFVSLKDGIITISYRDKTRTKKAEIELGDVDRARLAIKF